MRVLANPLGVRRKRAREFREDSFQSRNVWRRTIGRGKASDLCGSSKKESRVEKGCLAAFSLKYLRSVWREREREGGREGGKIPPSARNGGRISDDPSLGV